MRKTFKYIYTDENGRQTTLKKAITDYMQPKDDQKKATAAGYFTEMLRCLYPDPLPVVTRNIIET